MENRELLEEIKVRVSFKRRGRPPKTVKIQDHWFKKKQRERNRIERRIGNGKEHYRLDRVRYSIMVILIILAVAVLVFIIGAIVASFA